jgi:hypothetical protein
VDIEYLCFRTFIRGVDSETLEELRLLLFGQLTGLEAVNPKFDEILGLSWAVVELKGQRECGVRH